MGGNICNASPISDLNPLLVAAKAVVNLASVDGYRSLPVDASFFVGYKKTALKSNEVLVSVEIPFMSEVGKHTEQVVQSLSSIYIACGHLNLPLG